MKADGETPLMEELSRALDLSSTVFINDLAKKDYPKYKSYFKAAKTLESLGIAKTCHDWKKLQNYIIKFPRICTGCSRLEKCSREPSGERQDKKECGGPYKE